KTSEVPISTDGVPPAEPVAEPPESDDMFDEFEYEDEVLDEAEGYFIEGPPEDELYENPWKNYHGSAINLANMEVLPVAEPDPEDESVEVRLKKNIDAAPLSLEEKEKIRERLYVDKDIFARNVNDLGQTDIVTHEINTGTAVPIKQAPYRAAPS
ncbi:7846_t:CDS:1, partial [Gigaspora margarita]